MATTKEFKVIGTRPIRHDGVDKVTGRAIYGADLRLTGSLHGKVIRSPHAHAKIVSIDTSRAEALPGVKAVITSADFPEITAKTADLGEGGAVNVKDLRDNVLADKKALYRGHAIAAVAAADAHTAEEAVRLIDIKYEILPPVLDVRKAMEKDSPLLDEAIRTDDLGETSDTPSNVAKHMCFDKGDVEKGFASADKIFESECNTVMVHQGYIEPHNSTGLWNADGTVTVWCSTQGSFTVREQLSAVLQLPVSKIKVVPLEIGGGFGGKITVYLEPLSAILSKKTGKPVKMTMNREEVFEGTGPTPGSNIKVKIGARKDGKIVAAQADIAVEAGAFQGSPFTCAMWTVYAPYDIENVLIDGYDVLVNKPKTAAYRAPCATNAAMAAEPLIDEIAEWAGLDPLEFRKLNAAKEGTVRADGLKFPRIGCEETLDAALEHPHYRSKLEGPYRGRGVATGYWFNCGLKSSVTTIVNEDGTVNLVEGSTDIGGSRTSLAMQLAETIGVSAEDVRPQVVDTDSVGYNDVTGGSRVTYASGMAVIEAGKSLTKKMAERAAILWETDVSNVVTNGGTYSTKDGKTTLTFKELARKLGPTGGPVVAEGSVNADAGVGGGYGTHVVDLEVDPDTGKVTILRYTAVQDVGKAIHPSYVEGQIQGGAVQGIGWALNEEYYYDGEGQMRNASFLDYRIPTTLDLPMIDAVLVEVANPGHPYGVRGVGEVPIVPPPAAISNALYRAIGVRLNDLPMNPGRVLKAILTKNGTPPGE